MKWPYCRCVYVLNQARQRRRRYWRTKMEREARKEVKRGGDGGGGWTNDWDKAPACWHNDGLAGSHIAVDLFIYFFFLFTNNSDLIKGLRRNSPSSWYNELPWDIFLIIWVCNKDIAKSWFACESLGPAWPCTFAALINLGEPRNSVISY